MTKRRIVSAFLVAPLAAPVVFSVMSIATHPSDSRDLSLVGGQFIVACLYVVPFAYLSAFLLGIPTWEIFRHYRIYSLSAFAVGGAFIGLFAALILGALARTPITTLLNPLSPAWVRGGVLACVLAASASAVVFRSIVFRAVKKSNRCRHLHFGPFSPSISPHAATKTSASRSSSTSAERYVLGS